mmetsp:Transcript_35653/g.54840  ORF Transcript_35653/g.54840 Transcript_35653/m.54840 type:complete len:88 (-) Transcript_35653:49-312(-)
MLELVPSLAKRNFPLDEALPLEVERPLDFISRGGLKISSGWGGPPSVNKFMVAVLTKLLLEPVERFLASLVRRKIFLEEGAIDIPVA